MSLIMPKPDEETLFKSDSIISSLRKISKNAARRKVNRKMSQDISPVDKPLTILIKDNAKNKRPPSIKSML